LNIKIITFLVISFIFISLNSATAEPDRVWSGRWRLINDEVSAKTSDIKGNIMNLKALEPRQHCLQVTEYTTLCFPFSGAGTISARPFRATPGIKYQERVTRKSPGRLRRSSVAEVSLHQ
jgi:hypothetical protein